MATPPPPSPKAKDKDKDDAKADDDTRLCPEHWVMISEFPPVVAFPLACDDEGNHTRYFVGGPGFDLTCDRRTLDIIRTGRARRTRVVTRTIVEEVDQD